MLTSFNTITEDQLRNELVFIKNNLLLDDRDRIKAEHLIFTSGLTKLRLPQIMIFRGDDRRLDAASAVMHEGSELLNALDHEERLRIATLRLEYYNSNLARRVDERLAGEEATKRHAKNLEKFSALRKAREAKKREARLKVWRKTRGRPSRRTCEAQQLLINSLAVEASEGFYDYPEAKRRRIDIGPGVLIGYPKEMQARLGVEDRPFEMRTESEEEDTDMTETQGPLFRSSATFQQV